MENYEEMKKRHEEEINAIDIHFAFSNEQFDEILKNWNLTKDKEDLKKIVSIGSGGFIQRKDLPLLHETISRHKKELQELRKNEKHLLKMIEYEMSNHEYIYSYNDEQILYCLDISEEEKNSQTFKDIYNKAKNNYMAKARLYA